MNETVLTKAMDSAEDANNYLAQTKDLFTSLTENIDLIDNEHILKDLDDQIDKMEHVFENLDDIHRDLEDDDDFEKELSNIEDSLDEAILLAKQLNKDLHDIINDLEDFAHSAKEDEKYKEINDTYKKAVNAIMQTQKYYDSIF